MKVTAWAVYFDRLTDNQQAVLREMGLNIEDYSKYSHGASVKVSGTDTNMLMHIIEAAGVIGKQAVVKALEAK